MTEERTLRIERLVAGTPESVFEAWTNPDILTKWWGPDGVTIPQHELDVRPGGKWSTTMHSAEMGNRTVSGEYRTIDPPRRLVFTWAWHNDGERSENETEVAVDFAPVEGGTRLTLVQQRFHSIEARDNHHKGWESSVNGLAKYLAAQDAAV